MPIILLKIKDSLNGAALARVPNQIKSWGITAVKKGNAERKGGLLSML